MDANKMFHSSRKGTLRVALSVVLLSVVLGGCSSVPDAVNPVKWYEKTTDFFSGDAQAANTAPASNQGLSADPDAPAPAAPQQVASAPSGLNADAASSNYASPPIDRQGTASDVLRGEVAIAAAPTVPLAQPTVPVMAVPVAPLAPAPAVAPVAPVASVASVASVVPVAPSVMAAAPVAPAPAAIAPMPSGPTFERPASMSMAGAPPPPVFNAPANAVPALSDDVFETVVINSSGMSTVPPGLRPSAIKAAGLPQMANGAMFPEPGSTTITRVGGVSPNGMTRVATIHFANNSSVLDARDRSILGAVIQLQRERGGQVVVVGHASSRTRDMDYITHRMVNFQISVERAASIGNVLKNLGLEGEALEVQAVSDSTPLYMEVMPSGEAGNRRVEIYLAL